MESWHICGDGCLWWGQGQEVDFCNYDHGPAVEAQTGRPGCSRWTCTKCEGDWSDGEAHDQCLEIEVELE